MSGFPITDDGTSRGKVEGILTRRDLKFVGRDDTPVFEVMPSQNLVTSPWDVVIAAESQPPAACGATGMVAAKA